jgi:serine/threonine protein phosphatase PrpC
MSSTLVAVLFIPGFAVMANVGDSRFYSAGQDGSLKQISTDHTLANETVYQEYKEKFGAKAANTISRSIGARYNLQIEITRIPVAEGDRFLLCSDGVYRELSDDNLQTILLSSNSSRQTVNRIMRHVLLKGAHDNTTVVSVFPGKEPF